MHAHHLPSLHGLRAVGVALGLTLVLLVLAAALAPAIVDLSAPTVTTAETAAAGEPAPPPQWIEDPLAPPALLEAR